MLCVGTTSTLRVIPFRHLGTLVRNGAQSLADHIHAMLHLAATLGFVSRHQMVPSTSFMQHALLAVAILQARRLGLRPELGLESGFRLVYSGG